MTSVKSSAFPTGNTQIPRELANAIEKIYTPAEMPVTTKIFKL
jgi:hypothetical protein